jgi:hypothetical protein
LGREERGREGTTVEGGGVVVQGGVGWGAVAVQGVSTCGGGPPRGACGKRVSELQVPNEFKVNEIGLTSIDISCIENHIHSR